MLLFNENMRYSTFMGLLVVLLKQCCTSEGGPTPNQSNYSTKVTYQNGQTIPQHPELPAAEMPVVSPPSLKEVQKAVQEASEQVNSRGAGEVLKELLERVVEAALGHAEGGGEAKDEAAEKEVNHDAHSVKTGQLEAETLEQPLLDKNTNLKEGDAGFEEEAEAEADAFKDVAVEERGVVKVEGETAAGSMEKITEGVETGVREAETLEITHESPGTQLIPKVLEKASEETIADLERNEENSKEQGMPVLRNATEIKICDKEETPAAVDVVVDVQPEQETVDESKLGLGVADGEQKEKKWGKEVFSKEETPITELNGEIIVLPSKDSDIKTTEPIVGETAEVGKVAKGGEYAEGQEKADTNVDLVAGGEEEKTETEGTYFKEARADKENDNGVIMEESVASVNEGGDIQVGKEQTTLKKFHYVDVQESLIPGIQLEDSTEAFHRLEDQPPTPNPPASEAESEENTLWDENCDKGNEIITPTENFLPHNHDRSQPTIDNFENDVLAKYHQAKGGEPREANQLVKDLSGNRETDERGLKAWKIGAIFAAVFLVLETAVIILYIIKCQNRKSTLAGQWVCEDQCDEPKAPTGGDCSDDTLSAGKRNTRKIVTLKQSHAASTTPRNREQQEDKHVIAMSNVSSISKCEPDTSGPEPDS